MLFPVISFDWRIYVCFTATDESLGSTFPSLNMLECVWGDTRAHKEVKHGGYLSCSASSIWLLEGGVRFIQRSTP